MRQRRDEGRFLVKGQSRTVALKDDPRLRATLRGMILERIKTYGVVEIDLDTFGLSNETIEGIASDLQLEIAFEGSQAILSPSN
jgi:hypothetical protein